MTDCWAQLTWPLPFLRHFLKNSSTSRKSGRPPVVWCFELLSVPRWWEFQSGGLRDGKPSSSGQENGKDGIKRRLSFPLHPSHHLHPGSDLPWMGVGVGVGPDSPPCPHTGLSDFPSETETLTWLSSAESSVKLGGIYYLVQCLLWSHCHVIPGLYGPGCREGWGVNGGHLQENQDGYIIFCFLIDRHTGASSILPSTDPGYILGINTTLDCQNRKDPFISHPHMLFLGNIFRWHKHQNNIKRYSFNGLIPLWVSHSAQRQLLSWLPT